MGLSCLLLCFLITLQRYGLYFENASKTKIIFAKYAVKHIFGCLTGHLLVDRSRCTVGNKACCLGVVVNFALDVVYMRLQEDYGYKVEHIAC